MERKMSIAKAGRRLCLKPSTAKLIIKKFKEVRANSSQESYNPPQATIKPTEAIVLSP